MKRLLTLTLALLMVAALAAAAPAARAEEDPYVGLWEITGEMHGSNYTSYAEMGVWAMLDFRPDGIIYAVGSDGRDIHDGYLSYRVTGDNTLDLFDGDDHVQGTYLPAADMILVTTAVSGYVTYLERVRDDPLPDVYTAVDHSGEERTFYGYVMTDNGQAMNIMEILTAVDVDPRDYYLTLSPDGTGHMQFGTADNSMSFTWTEKKISIGGEDVACVWTKGHILLIIDELNSIEFVPEGEGEAMLFLLDQVEEGSAAKGYVGDLSGSWSKNQVDIAGWLSYSYDLDETLYNARSFQLTYCVVSSETVASGNCNVFIHIPGYGWKKIGSFALSRNDVMSHAPVSTVFEFDTPTTLDKVLVLPTFNMNFNSTLSLSEAWVYVD